MVKFEIPKQARPLWRQVLTGDVNLPRWEAKSQRSDVSDLLSQRLVTVVPGDPMYTMKLTDEKLKLTEEEGLILNVLSGVGLEQSDFLLWAKREGVAEPMKLIMNLMNLDVVTSRTVQGVSKLVLK